MPYNKTIIMCNNTQSVLCKANIAIENFRDYLIGHEHRYQKSNDAVVSLLVIE